jgi:molecular chaperone HtpG
MAHPPFVTDPAFGLSLGGIMALLRGQWESTPHVFVRELLRLAAGSLAARETLGLHVQRGDDAAEIHVHLVERQDGVPPTLLVEDNGIGLTEDEVRHGLATIGGFCRANVEADNSPRRPDASTLAVAGANGQQGAGDLVSRLGLGLVTCFSVADEVRVLTRSLDRGSLSLEWVGRADGTYSLRRLDYAMQPGTQVYVRPRPESRPLFEPALLRQAAAAWGEFLPYPLHFSHGGERRPLNARPPWSIDRSDANAWREAQLAAGRRLLGDEFLDAVPIRSGAGGVEGVALVRDQRQSLLEKPIQRVYHGGVLLAERATNLLPDWAGFMACIVHVGDLQPTLMFDGLQDSQSLARVRRALGRSLHLQLAEMAEAQPRRWRQILNVQLPAMKSLAAESDEFFRLFIDLLPFDSSAGRASLGQLARQHLAVHYINTQRHVGQLAELAAALGLGVVFAGDAQETALLEKAARRVGAAPLRELDVGELAKWLSDLEAHEQRAVAPFLDLADEVLRPLGCAAEVKRFGTPRMLALLLPPAAARRDDFPTIPARDPASAAYGQLWLNGDHPMVRQLVEWTDREAVAKAVKLIYAQAKLASTGEVDRVGAKLLFEGLRESLEG